MGGIERRGPAKAAANGYPAPLPRCAAMAVGSVPHIDPVAAVDLVFATTPEIPAWPQLPRRSFLENMYVQFSEGLPGLVVDEAAERVYIHDPVPEEELLRFLELLEEDEPGAFRIGSDHAAGIPVLGEALGGSRPPFVKGQVTGPISFGLTIPREDRRALFYDDTLRDAAVRLLVMKARWQERLLASWAPGALPLVMVDEPYLTQLGSAFVSIPEDISFPALEDCLAGIGCLAGIHVCGGTDWSRITELPVDLLNFDAADHLAALLAHREGVASFVSQGGLLAWGVIPNDERVESLNAEETGRRVLEGAEALAQPGAPGVDEILARSFVSPACGTGSLPLPVAERCLALAAETSEWLRARL